MKISEDEGFKLGKEEANALWNKLNSSIEIPNKDTATVAFGKQSRKNMPKHSSAS